MRLIFFIATPVVLCLGSVTQARLIAHQWVGYCWAALTQHQSRFSLFPLFSPVTRLQIGMGLGGDMIQAAGSGWQEDYYMSQNVMLSNKNRGGGFRGGSHCLETSLGIGLLVGHGEWLPLHLLFYFSCLFSSLIKLYLDTQVSSLGSFCSLPLSCWGLGKGGEAAWSLVAAAQGELTTPQSSIYQDELLQWVILECKIGYLMCLMV